MSILIWLLPRVFYSGRIFGMLCSSCTWLFAGSVFWYWAPDIHCKKSRSGCSWGSLCVCVCAPFRKMPVFSRASSAVSVKNAVFAWSSARPLRMHATRQRVRHTAQRNYMKKLQPNNSFPLIYFFGSQGKRGLFPPCRGSGRS